MIFKLYVRICSDKILYVNLAICSGGALDGQEGYQAHPKIHVKSVLFYNRPLYVRNVNWISNSCKLV